MTKEYDIIVVGGGHNGLVAAAYLADAGLDVLVLERRDIIGGACVTEELIPGFRFSTASMFVGSLNHKVIEDLELSKYGFEWYTTDPTDIFMFPYERCLCCWKDEEKLVEEISKFSTKDAQAYLQFEREYQRYEEYLTPLELRPPPSFPEVASRFKTPDEQELFRTYMLGSMAEFVESRFETEEARMLVAALAPVGHSLSLRSKGNMHPYTRDHWGFSRGGMGAITRAMAESARSRGASIRANTEVKHVLVRDGKAAGVVLVDGEEIRAKAVASNADPKRTFLHLVEPEHLEEKFRDKVDNIQMKGDFAKLFIALDGRPQWECFGDEDPGTRDHGFININPSIEYSEKALRDCQDGHPSQDPLFMLHLQSLTDDSLAPPGKHAMTVYVQYAPYNLKEGSWEEERDRFSKRCIDTLAEYSPNLKDLIVDYVFFGPRDIEERFYLTESTMVHGDSFPDQMFGNRPVPGWSQYRTPLRDLYLCGSGAYPGGGVTGVPGHNASQAIIQDWREGVIA